MSPGSIKTACRLEPERLAFWSGRQIRVSEHLLLKSCVPFSYQHLDLLRS